MEILSLMQAAVAKDGSHLLLTFATKETPTTIEVAGITLRGILPELAALAARATAPDQENVVPVTKPSGFRVVPSEDKKKLVIGFRLPNGLEHHFEVSPNEARQLQVELEKAVQSCKS